MAGPGCQRARPIVHGMHVILRAISAMHRACIPNVSGMNDERERFSRRLGEALRKAGYLPRPGILHKLFNSRYSGPSVSTQTVSRWLGGKTIPEQDKLQVLAQILGVSPHYLRYGAAPASVSLGEGQPHWAGELNAHQWQVMQSFLSLPGGQQSLVGEMVGELARLNAELASKG